MHLRNALHDHRRGGFANLLEQVDRGSPKRSRGLPLHRRLDLEPQEAADRAVEGAERARAQNQQNKVELSRRLTGRLKNFVRRFSNRKLFKRNHQKVILVDDNVFIGSSNIGEDYGGEKYGNSSFVDLNMRIKGYVTEKMYSKIDNVILKNKPRRLNLSKQKRKKQKMCEEFGKVPRQKDSEYVRRENYDLLLSSTHHIEIQKKLFNHLVEAEKKVTIIAPYYSDSIIQYLPIKEAAQRGVEIEILTSKKRDIDCYKDLENGVLFSELIKSGVKVYEYNGKFLHGKALLFDDQVLQLGSFNLDGWSNQNNTGSCQSSFNV